MLIFFLLLSHSIALDLGSEEDLPPGFYRVSFAKGRNVTYTPISTSMEKRVLHNGVDITAYDFRLATGSVQIQTVQNQGSCGSCWAFAASDLAGAAHYLNSYGTADVVNKVMSAQNILNCASNYLWEGYNYAHEGCNGGYTDLAVRDVMQSGTVERDCIGYVTQQRNCTASCTSTGRTFKKYIDKTADVYIARNITDMGFLRKMLVTSGPAVASFSVYSCFDSYTSGIYTKTSSIYEGGHAVVVYGFGVQNGVNYWLVKNSWGMYWGEGGYFKIRMGTNEANFEKEWVFMNNYLNTSRPRRGVPLPSQPSVVGPNWNCSVQNTSCNTTMGNYITDNSTYIPPPLPTNTDYEYPTNYASGTRLYVNTTGTGTCTSTISQCSLVTSISNTATNKVVFLSAEIHLMSAYVTITTQKNFSFLGAGMAGMIRTTIGTTHSGAVTYDSSYRMMYAWYVNYAAGPASLYFSNLIMWIRNMRSGSTSLPESLAVFRINGTSVNLTCSYVHFKNADNVKGLVVELLAGKARFSNCLVADTISNSTLREMFCFLNATASSIPSVLTLQNCTVKNFTTGAGVVGEHSSSSVILQLSFIKCFFFNITGTNNAAITGVSATNTSQYRLKGLIYTCINYHRNRTVHIRGCVFRTVNGAAGAHAAGVLFFYLRENNSRPLITNCTFYGCSGRCAGAVFTTGGEQYYENCTFEADTKTSTLPFAGADFAVSPNRTEVIYSYPQFSGSCSKSLQPRINTRTRGDMSYLLPTCESFTACVEILDNVTCVAFNYPGYPVGVTWCTWLENPPNSNFQGKCQSNSALTCSSFLSQTQCTEYLVMSRLNSRCAWQGSNTSGVCVDMPCSTGTVSSCELMVPVGKTDPACLWLNQNSCVNRSTVSCGSINTSSQCQAFTTNSTAPAQCCWQNSPSPACKDSGTCVSLVTCNDIQNETACWLGTTTSCCWQLGGHPSLPSCRDLGTCTIPTSCEDIYTQDVCTSWSSNLTVVGPECVWVLLADGWADTGPGFCMTKSSMSCSSFVSPLQCNTTGGGNICMWKTSAPGSEGPSSLSCQPCACEDVFSPHWCTTVTPLNQPASECLWVLDSNDGESDGKCVSVETLTCASFTSSLQCDAYTDAVGSSQCCWQIYPFGVIQGACQTAGTCVNSCEDLTGSGGEDAEGGCTQVVLATGVTSQCIWLRNGGTEGGRCVTKSTVSCASFESITQCNTYNAAHDSTGGVCIWKATHPGIPLSCVAFTCGDVEEEERCTSVTSFLGETTQCLWVVDTNTVSGGKCHNMDDVGCSHFTSSTQCNAQGEASSSSSSSCCWQHDSSVSAGGTCQSGGTCIGTCEDVATAGRCSEVELANGSVSTCVWLNDIRGNTLGRCAVQSSITCTDFMSPLQCNEYNALNGGTGGACVWKAADGDGDEADNGADEGDSMRGRMGTGTRERRTGGTRTRTGTGTQVEKRMGRNNRKATTHALEVVGEIGECVPYSCGDVTTAEMCTTVTPLGGEVDVCVWIRDTTDGDTGRCSSSTSITCASFPTSPQCESYGVENSIAGYTGTEVGSCCWQQDQSVYSVDDETTGVCQTHGTCIQRCEDITVAMQCGEVHLVGGGISQCIWVRDSANGNTNGVCLTASTLTCASFVGAQQCREYNEIGDGMGGACMWAEAGIGICVPYACSDVFDKAKCTTVTPLREEMSECTWIRNGITGNDGRCVPTASLSCGLYLTASQCEAYTVVTINSNPNPNLHPCCWQVSAGYSTGGYCRNTTDAGMCTAVPEQAPTVCEDVLSATGCTEVTLLNGFKSNCLWLRESEFADIPERCITRSLATCTSFVSRTQCISYNTVDDGSGSACAWRYTGGEGRGVCVAYTCEDVTVEGKCSRVKPLTGTDVETETECVWVLNTEESRSGSCLTKSQALCTSFKTKTQCMDQTTASVYTADHNNGCCWLMANTTTGTDTGSKSGCVDSSVCIQQPGEDNNQSESGDGDGDGGGGEGGDVTGDNNKNNTDNSTTNNNTNNNDNNNSNHDKDNKDKNSRSKVIASAIVIPVGCVVVVVAVALTISVFILVRKRKMSDKQSESDELEMTEGRSDKYKTKEEGERKGEGEDEREKDDEGGDSRTGVEIATQPSPEVLAARKKQAHTQGYKRAQARIKARQTQHEQEKGKGKGKGKGQEKDRMEPGRSEQQQPHTRKKAGSSSSQTSSQSQSPTQSLSEPPSYSPTDSPSESPTHSPTQFPSQSQTQLPPLQSASHSHSHSDLQVESQLQLQLQSQSQTKLLSAQSSSSLGALQQRQVQPQFQSHSISEGDNRNTKHSRSDSRGSSLSQSAVASPAITTGTVPNQNSSRSLKKEKKSTPREIKPKTRGQGQTDQQSSPLHPFGEADK